jgi:hypothetical protein
MTSKDYLYKTNKETSAYNMQPFLQKDRHTTIFDDKYILTEIPRKAINKTVFYNTPSVSFDKKDVLKTELNIKRSRARETMYRQQDVKNDVKFTNNTIGVIDASNMIKNSRIEIKKNLTL